MTDHQASPIVPTRWDALSMPREEYIGPAPQFPGDREQFVYSSPEYQAWLEQAHPLFEARREREQDWDRAARNAIATGRLTPKEVTDLGYRPEGHAVDTDYSAAPWGKWQPLPSPLYHVTTNLPGIAASGVLRSPYELDHGIKNRGLGSYGSEEHISLTHSLDEAREIERAFREASDVASGRLPVERLVEMARTGEGAQKPWLNAMFGNHDWSTGNPRGLDDLLLGREPFYSHKLPEDHPLKGMTGAFQYLSPEEWAQHGYEPYPDAPALGTPEAPKYTTMNVFRYLNPEEKAKAAFEWWRNPYAPMRHYVGKGPTDPLFASSDPDWFANLDPSHIGIVQAEPVPGAHGYPMSALGEWRIPTGQAVNITHLNGQPYVPPTTSHVKLAHPLYKRWVFSPATGQVTLADNTGDPLNVKYHTDLARELNEPNLVHGYAVRIGDGWRLSDWESRPVDDPFIVAQVMRALLTDGSERPQEALSSAPEDPDWSRVHHAIPAT